MEMWVGYHVGYQYLLCPPYCVHTMAGLFGLSWKREFSLSQSKKKSVFYPASLHEVRMFGKRASVKMYF